MGQGSWINQISFLAEYLNSLFSWLPWYAPLPLEEENKRRWRRKGWGQIFLLEEPKIPAAEAVLAPLNFHMESSLRLGYSCNWQPNIDGKINNYGTFLTLTKAKLKTILTFSPQPNLSTRCLPMLHQRAVQDLSLKLTCFPVLPNRRVFSSCW